MPQETEGVVGAILAVLVTALILAVIVLVIAALISILAERDLTGGGKLLWVLGVLYLPILGSVAWFVVGRKGYLNQFLGITHSGRHAAPHTYPAAHTAPEAPVAAEGRTPTASAERRPTDEGQRPSQPGASAAPSRSPGRQEEVNESGLGHA